MGMTGFKETISVCRLRRVRGLKGVERGDLEMWKERNDY